MKRILLTAALFGTIIFQSFAQVHKGTHNGQEWVDLGLSVKWATCNVGADNPGDYGKLIYWHDEVDYDEWSPEWRLPSKHHFNELIDKCTWVWKVVDGNPGYYITGPNGASIFLPASGYFDGYNTLSEGSMGIYWGWDDSSGSTYPCLLKFYSDDRYILNMPFRNFARNIRYILY